MFITARTLRYINIRDVYMTLRPFQVRVLCIIKNSKNPASGFLEFWRGTRDSNPQPTDSKSATLSIELVPQKYIIDYMIIPDVYTCIKGFIDIYLKMAHNKERLSFFWQWVWVGNASGKSIRSARSRCDISVVRPDTVRNLCLCLKKYSEKEMVSSECCRSR